MHVFLNVTRTCKNLMTPTSKTYLERVISREDCVTRIPLFKLPTISTTKYFKIAGPYKYICRYITHTRNVWRYFLHQLITCKSANSCGYVSSQFHIAFSKEFMSVIWAFLRIDLNFCIVSVETPKKENTISIK